MPPSRDGGIFSAHLGGFKRQRLTPKFVGFSSTWAGLVAPSSFISKIKATGRRLRTAAKLFLSQQIRRRTHGELSPGAHRRRQGCGQFWPRCSTARIRLNRSTAWPGY